MRHYRIKLDAWHHTGRFPGECGAVIVQALSPRDAVARLGNRSVRTDAGWLDEWSVTDVRASRAKGARNSTPFGSVFIHFEGAGQ